MAGINGSITESAFGPRGQAHLKGAGGGNVDAGRALLDASKSSAERKGIFNKKEADIYEKASKQQNLQGQHQMDDLRKLALQAGKLFG